MKVKALRDYIRRNPHVWLVLYVPVFLILYFTVETLVPSDGDYWVSYMPLDDHIPFAEAFVVPYCLWYPYLIATGLLLMIKDRDNFLKYMYFIMAGFTASLLFCLIVPNGQNLRPDSFERDNIFTVLLSLIYAADTNTNVFPSMHIIGCIAGTVAAFHSRCMVKLRWPSLILALLISASTVLIKQHSFLDIIGGVAFGAVLYILIYIVPKRRRKRRRI